MNPNGSWVNWRAQVGTLAGDARRVEARAVGATRPERHPGHPLRAVTAVGIELADDTVDVHPLMGERADSGVAGVGEHFTEGLAFVAGAGASRPYCRSSR